MADRTQTATEEPEDGARKLTFTLDEIGETALNVLGERLSSDPDSLPGTGILQMCTAWLKIKEREAAKSDERRQEVPDALDTLGDLPPERQIGWLDQELGRLAERANLIRARRAGLVKPELIEVKE